MQIAKGRVITVDLMDIKKIKREYHKQVNAHKFDNLDERDQFLERYILPLLTKRKIENLALYLL